jgi:hypothetical protein
MSQYLPIFAFGGQELIGIAVFVIIVIIQIVSQFLSKQREQQDQQRRPDRRPREVEPMDEMQAGLPQGQQPGRPQVKKPVRIEDEIGEFLRRAARGGGERPAQPRPQQQTRPKPAPPVRPRASVPRQPQRPLRAEVVEPARPPVGQGLSDQVARDIDTTEIKRHLSELGKGTRLEAAKLESQIKEKFDRELGTLRREKKAAPEKPEETHETALPITSAAGLGALLSDTESLKQAIILNEILQRPAHRW